MAQQPGTLVPGQSISVNKYTVQVERYLSQGGFAHVYLVRTATPVYNTTHHVLKRIAVANDAMLTEVKKEVDIMRLLKGHPNIVHLIDAAWHRMANGMYEVFILMEFCPGGGIIDMMNRRLRERLTEAEILQIFVDVCEGVAYMHNSRPPLLHRDLKVENILQSSATSFKLCDFGSATTVGPRPPATTQEIRALEADLNRHTTLQYRAPEMVDPYLRRPVDEKSDVWALGVLLYKLCYYTTPFEEHGPLAILNVQYRIPPYPVYSAQMNSLIASMLREHGAHRPSVFELLALVHRLRGTKSPFTYTIPAPQPLSPRHQTQFPASQTSNPLDSTITYRSQQQQALQRNPNAGVQARDKVLEAIAPMRRGRPEPQQHSASPSRPRTSSPQKERTQPLVPPQQPQPQQQQQPQAKNWLDEEEKAWKAATVKTGTSVPKRSAMDDAWLARGGSGGGGDTSSLGKGFGDDFAEKLWDSLEPNGKSAKALSSVAPEKLNVASPPLRQPAFTGSFVVQRGGKDKDKDAFEGLGGLGSGEKPAPTLGEARLLRTGLAGTTSTHSYKFDGDYKDFKPGRPSPSPRPSYGSTTPPAAQLLSPQPPAIKPMGSGSSWLSQPPSSMSRPSSSNKEDGNDAAETRFPSLEELDKTFGSSPPSNGYTQSPQPPPLPARKESSPIPPTQLPKEIVRPTPSYGSPQLSNAALRDGALRNLANRDGAGSSSDSLNQQRPPLTRKHRSSLTMKHSYASSSSDDSLPSSAVRMGMGMGSVSAGGLAPAALQSSQRDWLTGDDDDVRTPLGSSHTRTATTPAVYSTRTPATADYSASPPVLRQSPSKRTSIIEKSGLHIPEAAVAQRDYAEPSPILDTPSSPSARAAHMFPALDLTSEPSDHGWGPSTQKEQKDIESASSADEGPEDANGFMSTPMNKAKTTQEAARTKKKIRQSSVHDLVDLYGGAGSLAFPSKEKERVSPSLLEDLTSKKTLVNDPSTDSKAKRRSATLALSMAKPPPSNSINSTLSPPNSGRPPPSPNSDKSGATSPRSRPQSMFLFPSKSTDSTSPSTLSPPAEEPRMQRAHTRRTSISDMVQRYEAIGGSAVKAPSPIPPPLSNKPATISENGRYSVPLKSSSSPSSSPINGRPAGSISLPISASSSTGLVEPPKAVIPRRVSPTGLPRTSTPQREPESGGLPPVRSRRTSYKSFDTSGGASGAPSRKGTTDERAPSPERPYQGVGKLIDQWQRKTAETERGPAGGAKRGGGSGGFVAKRAGLVGKGA